jgi:hypothetical protein
LSASPPFDPRRARFCSSAASSPAVTPRSKAIRSTLLSLNLRINSLIVALTLCIGVSATTRSLPTMPTAIEGCC